MAFKLYNFDNALESNIALVKAIVSSLEKYLSFKDRVNLAFSGGKSPIDFLELLSKEDCAWHRCNVSLVDERIVDLNDENSNARLITTHFLKNLAQKSYFQTYFENPNIALDKLVCKANIYYQQPDIAILGMGLDGHTASLFCDAQEFQQALKTHQNIVLMSPKNAPYKRLSMSLSALEKCKELFLSISTEEKLKVLNKALEAIDPKLPISYILHSKKVVCNVYFSK
ncbi:6-phosphogluconolactonase [Campylobacter hepaticus]|uniref:6-phosphogluconolactonase n=1 Tax=Campylobacter hepaticus TaxID=1813019 RepID=A0A424YYJ9_9BACT|nr:6-phosphogluconolactonase [Campylobacter hepaticus]AXP08687.1 6-phosphogluconolactonase [Campylobacter hepaticus]MCZ0772532.1 6-phosphogluconolactonase [Campylobacter hepaticus]MCZ0774000.1 6-phosphogluconolactonase [Campylobacter hepaticus]MCZ0775252.1 6-phosphogluconolactonase [Campylobacter hepaticus]MDX2324016.1 6-phosphogluconolactonase [Campylobacter hepaticus]